MVLFIQFKMWASEKLKLRLLNYQSPIYTLEQMDTGLRMCALSDDRKGTCRLLYLHEKNNMRTFINTSNATYELSNTPHEIIQFTKEKQPIALQLDTRTCKRTPRRSKHSYKHMHTIPPFRFLCQSTACPKRSSSRGNSQRHTLWNCQQIQPH